jgi:hypothetical protein
MEEEEPSTTSEDKSHKNTDDKPDNDDTGSKHRTIPEHGTLGHSMMEPL